MNVLLALLSCQAPSVPGSSFPGSSLGASDDGLAAIQLRLASEARAIHPRGEGFRANLPLLGSQAHFDTHGVRLAPRGSADEGLSVRFRGWGRSQPTPVEAVQPGLGACTDERDPIDRCVQRLEYAHAGLTEWWIGLDTGLEQGWTLTERPPGDGPVVIDVALDGLRTMVPGAGELRLVDRSGAAWTLGRLQAWDATGAAIPVRLAAAAGGFQILIDDRGARWPLTVDPVYESAATTFLGGVGRLGSALAGVGDVNGDGFDDVLVSAPALGDDTGTVRLHLGDAGGLSLTPTSILQGERSASSFGASLVGAGDLDGDGYADVAVGAPAEDDRTGAVRIYIGGPTGLSTEPSLVLRGDSPGQAFGTSLAGGLDLNGDGHPDLAVGAPRAGDENGRVSIYLGSATGLSPSADIVLNGSADAGAFGSSLALLEDLDGDGFDELAVGAPLVDSLRGTVSVFPGSASGPAEEPLLVLAGDGSLEGFGTSITTAGDVNGDGHPDLAVGAPYGGESGRVYIHSGSEGGLVDVPSSTLTITDYTRFGWQVAGAGDVNGDGYDDLIVGSPDNERAEGAASLFLGASTGLAEEPSLRFEGPASGETGFAVAGAGDVDGDGYDDILVGSPGAEDERGQAELFQGRAEGPSGLPGRTLTGDEASVFFGQTLAGAGDLDGDGFDEVVIGAWWSQRVYLYSGSATGVSPIATAVLPDPDEEGSAFGRSLAGAGDLDGDGFDDLAVGAPSADDGRGWVFVYSGSASGIDPSAAEGLEGPEADSAFGSSLDAAGDTNGDGFDDLVIGAYLYESRTGRAYLAQGSASGLSARELRGLSAPDADSSFGLAVAGLGDVDADGYDDVLVGAPRYDSDTGRAYLYRGASSGLSSEATLTLTGTAVAGQFGSSLAGPGDVNGDGYADAAVGASAADDDAGEVHLFLGGEGGLPDLPDQSLAGEAGSRFGQRLAAGGDLDMDGFADLAIGASELSVAGLGGSAGGVFVYEGGEDGLAAEPVLQLFGSRVNQALGSALAMAGDVNGDGYGDLLVGSQASSAWIYLGYADDDGDGVLSIHDCDDADPEVGEPSQTLYQDADGDGYGDPETGALRCEDEGLTTDATDCDDSDPGVNPGAEEIPGDGLDQDCDGADADPGDGGGSDGGSSDGGSSDGGGSVEPGEDPDGDKDKGRCDGCSSATPSLPGVGGLFAIFALLGLRRRP